MSVQSLLHISYCIYYMYSKYTMFLDWQVKLALMLYVSCSLLTLLPVCMLLHVLHLGFPQGIVPLVVCVSFNVPLVKTFFKWGLLE